MQNSPYYISGSVKFDEASPIANLVTVVCAQAKPLTRESAK